MGRYHVIHVVNVKGAAAYVKYDLRCREQKLKSDGPIGAVGHPIQKSWGTIATQWQFQHSTCSNSDLG